MIDCPLKQLADGRWWCPRCDPKKERLLPVKARRNCRKPEGVVRRVIRRLTRPYCGCRKGKRKIPSRLFSYRR